MDRRVFLKAVLETALLARWPVGHALAAASKTPRLAKFVDPLPFPSIARPVGQGPVPRYVLRMHKENGQLDYPEAFIPEFFGDTVLVNGMVWPYVDVEPRTYRLRLLNGSNARFYRLSLSSDQPFMLIGTDAGFLDKPLSVNSVLLAPAERLDVLVDFQGLKGEKVVLQSRAPAPYPLGEAPRLEVLQFRVNKPLQKAPKDAEPGSAAFLDAWEGLVPILQRNPCHGCPRHPGFVTLPSRCVKTMSACSISWTESSGTTR